MIKQTVNYTDFDGNEQEETLYFNITKTEMTDMLDFKDDLEALSKRLSGPERVLDDKDVKDILSVVKRLARDSYGIRSEDGKRFKKSPEIWQEFTETAVYDAWMFGMFENPTKAFDFMTGILPQDLVEEARAQMGKPKVALSELQGK